MSFFHLSIICVSLCGEGEWTEALIISAVLHTVLNNIAPVFIALAITHTYKKYRSVIQLSLVKLD